MYEQTIPVQIDRIIDTPRYQIARCAFFRIESVDRPLALAGSPLLPEGLSLTVWGDWAVLAGPMGSSGVSSPFESAQALEEALGRIEVTGELLTDLGYLWMPLSLLRRGREEGPRKGDVYRISRPLFSYGYSRTLRADSTDACTGWEMPEESEIAYSPEESGAFRRWRRMQIDQSRIRARARRKASEGEEDQR
jgi:hypothetical protein